MSSSGNDVASPWIFDDVQASPNERRWLVRPATAGPGIVVETFDDFGALFDSIELRRYGAFIVLEPKSDGVPEKLPASLEFLRPAIVARARLRLIGIQQDPAPVLVNSLNMRRVMELGHFPTVLVKTFPKAGMAEFFGVRCVWHEDLDRYVPLA